VFNGNQLKGASLMYWFGSWTLCFLVLQLMQLGVLSCPGTRGRDKG
jgi:hypothetical protein